MRKDGKFVGVDGSVPEGQGIVMAHLNECHELLEMVRLLIFTRCPSVTSAPLTSCSSVYLQLKQSMDEHEEEEDSTEDDDTNTFDPDSTVTSDGDT